MDGLNFWPGWHNQLFESGCQYPVTGMCSSVRHPWLLDCGEPSLRSLCRNDGIWVTGWSILL